MDAYLGPHPNLSIEPCLLLVLIDSKKVSGSEFSGLIFRPEIAVACIFPYTRVPLRTAETPGVERRNKENHVRSSFNGLGAS